MRENFYTTNLQPVAMCEYILYCKFTARGNALKPHVANPRRQLYFCKVCINNETVGIVQITREKITGD
jgi:hypothetical protein